MVTLLKVLGEFDNEVIGIKTDTTPWTREQLAKELNASEARASDEEIKAGIEESLKTFKLRLEKDFEEDADGNFILKTNMADNKKHDGSRKKKVEEMTRATKLWSGTYVSGKGWFGSEKTRNQAAKYYADELIKNSCKRTKGFEKRTLKD